ESVERILRRRKDGTFLGQALSAHASRFGAAQVNTKLAAPLVGRQRATKLKGKNVDKTASARRDSPTNVASTATDERRPNPKLAAGMKLPPNLSERFPVKKLSGVILEDIDEFYADKLTCVVIARDKTIFRFSATKALMLLSPFNPIRRCAIKILTHPAFSMLVLLAIICNCVFMAMNSSSETVEYTFTAIYTTEAIIKAISRGLILSNFTYLRDAWNWLDFIVIGLAYIMFFSQALGNLSALRSLRVLRALKTVTTVPGLKTIVGALMEAVKRLRDVGILTIFVLSIFALVGLQVYKGTLLQKCVVKFNLTEYLDMEQLTNYTELSSTEQKILEQKLRRLHGNNYSNWYRNPTVRVCSLSDQVGQQCPEGYECFRTNEANPDFGYTNFDNFGWSMLCAFRLMTQDYWESLYQLVIRTNGKPHVFYFAFVIMLGSFFLMNVILAIVAMAYDEVRRQDKLDEEEEAARKQDEENQEQEFNKDGPFSESYYSDEMSCLSLRDIYKVAGISLDRFKQSAEELSMQSDKIEGGHGHTCQQDSETREQIVDMQEVILLKTLVNESSETAKNQDSIDIEGKRKEKKTEYFKRRFLDKCCDSWDCCDGWKVFEKYVAFIILDPFTELYITLCILVNTGFMALDMPTNSKKFSEFLSNANLFFTATFAVEAICKLIAMKPRVYFKDGWNIFDFCIVVLSLAELPLQNIQGLSILRAFRLLRVFKLAKSWQTMNLLFAIIARTMGALGNLVFVLGIIIFIFAVVGMQLFGENYSTYKNTTLYPHYKGDYPRWNFKDFTHSFMIVFRVLCGEWIDSMWNCMNVNGFICMPFFLLTNILASLVVLSLFLALLLSSFGAESLQRREVEEEVNKLQGLLIESRDSLCSQELNDEDLFESDSQDVDEPDAENADKRGPRISPDGRFALKRHGAFLMENVSIAASNMVFKDINELHANRDACGEAHNKIYPTCQFSLALEDQFPPAFEEPEINEVDIVYWDAPEDCFPKKLTKHCPNVMRLFDTTRFGKAWWIFRCQVYKIVEHKYFEMFIILMIALSSITLTVEDVNLHKKPKLKLVLEHMDKCFTVIFTLEMVLKWVAFGLKKYFKDAWCWLDFIIVNVALCSLVLIFLGGASGQSMGAFKAMRTLRALRPLRAVSRWEGMKVVVNALIQAIPSIFNVLLVCLVFWLIFSIMGVQLFGGQFYKCVDNETQERLLPEIVPNQSVCEEMARKFGNVSWQNSRINFDNVLNGYLALFQIATYKGWLGIIADAVDITGVGIQPQRDASTTMYLFFVLFIIFGSFFTLKLFIGVIIDNFNMQKKRAGGSMEIFLTEDQKKYYKAMKKMSSSAPQKPVPKPKLRISQFFFKITSNQKFDVVIMIFIMLNTIVMCIEHHDQSEAFNFAVEQINRVFIVIFTFECVMKLMAQRWYYFKFPWNVFDFVIVVLSILTWAVEDIIQLLRIPPTIIRVVRVFRVGRVLRLVKSARGIRTLLFSLFVSLPALFNIGLLLVMIMFIYSIVGISFFSHVRHSSGIDEMFNFETFPSGMVVLFQLSTSAGWDSILDGLINEKPPHCDPDKKPHSDCGSFALAVLFLVSYLVISFLVIINMYIAVILENFSQATEDVQQGLTQEDFDLFYEKWESYDPKAKGFIPVSRVYEFLDELEPPLQLPMPNRIKLATLNVPICKGETIFCVDLLDALTRNFLGTAADEEQLAPLKPKAGGKIKEERIVISNTLERQKQRHAARIIMNCLRARVEKRKALQVSAVQE
uniref:Sodium channel protein n=1 Tax=Macrostomum lignano TaxID=282301 RepID=A0A1I8JLI5_9PLAT